MPGDLNHHEIERMAMDDIQKLRMLIPHWVEHTQEHGAEFIAWTDKAVAAGNPAAADLVRQAAREMMQVKQTLQAAVDALGGALEAEHHHH
jgi:hypothetical protein